MIRSTVLSCILFTVFSGHDAVAQEIDFSRQILPILSDKCFICHGPDTDADLRLDSFAGATADLGGYRGIDPANPAKSEILERIHSSDSPMPPEDFDKQLTNKERELISRWVKAGGKYSKHWSFVRPEKTLPPGVDAPSPTAVIDAIVAIQLAKAQIEFAPEAERTVLARRTALVLTGLPPEPDQLKSFLVDKSQNAFEVYVDQLLASPRYGEHQTRYWLDAVRYGDTHGLHLDNRRGIYPYRDWVVKAHNENLPLDQFITWQLAGDLLPDATLEQKVATGFVRLNPSTAEGGAIPAEFQAKNNFDRVETFGTVFLGMSLTCARCHTHKYDPITQTEYYQLLAFFNNTAEPAMDGNSYTYGTNIKAPPNYEEWLKWSQLEKARNRLIASADKQLENAAPQVVERWNSASKHERLSLLAAKKGPVSDSDLELYSNVVRNGINDAQRKFTTTLIAAELPKRRETRLLSRGEYNLPTGDALLPDTFDVMNPFPQNAPKNRLGLAYWLTAPEHPLTSRVLANQIWQRVFGFGLVRTPEDFGLQGQQPTHPELLDWLAVELQDSGWNLKHMLKSMVMSRTFRQDSAWRVEIDDPENRLFARGPGYRLDAEVIRDIGLWSSGLLDPTMGGEGVKPYQPAGMWLAMAHPGSNTKNYVQDKGPRLYRRSLYVYWKRTSPHPMMTLFDAPSRESSCIRREPTSTPLQSLALLNETQRIEMARKLAERLIVEANDEPARFNLLFSLLASRPPTETETAVCHDLLASMQERYSNDKPAAESLLNHGESPRNKKLDSVELAAWTQVCSTILASDVAILLY